MSVSKKGDPLFIALTIKALGAILAFRIPGELEVLGRHRKEQAAFGPLDECVAPEAALLEVLQGRCQA